MLGGECVVLNRITDNSLTLKIAEKQLLGDMIADLEDAFPQLFLLLYIGRIPTGLSLAEFGFWLLNHAAVNDLDFTRPNENGLLLVMDPDRNQASLTTGYFIEKFLPESLQLACLMKSSRLWEEGETAAGLARFIQELHIRLTRSARKSGRPAQPASVIPAPSEYLAQLGLTRMRENHTGSHHAHGPLKDPDALGSEDQHWWLDPE
jgi:hypothetical protein